MTTWPGETTTIADRTRRGSAGPAGSLRQVPAGGIGIEDECESVQVSGRHLARLDWTRVTLRGCLVELADVAELTAERARVIDSTLREPDVTHLRAGDSTWRSVEVQRGRIGAWDLPGSVLDSMLVVGAQLGYVNLRDATMNDVALQDCRIGTLDLVGASAGRVRLPGCIVEELVVTRAQLDRVDLRGARLGRIEGVEHLAGAVISADQLLDVAVDLARAAGITVGPWPE